jgi:hypothetical protein
LVLEWWVSAAEEVAGGAGAVADGVAAEVVTGAIPEQSGWTRGPFEQPYGPCTAGAIFKDFCSASMTISTL